VDTSLLLAVASGIAVAAACGLRAFLPLLLLGLAARLGLVELRHGATWLAGDLALVALAVATAVEVAGDKLPVVDHALDAVGTVVRPAAAWLGAYAVLQSWPTPWAQIAALVLGMAALGIHGLKSSLRLGSTATTHGLANPALSVLEDLAAAATLAVAVLAPVLAIAIPVLILFAFRRRRHRAR